MSKELKKNEQNELMFGADTSALNKMAEDSKEYQDDTSADDIAIPRLRILQSMSEQIKKSSPEHVEGAEEGDLFNTISQEIYKGDKGCFFIPVKRRVVYLEWNDLANGGGLVNNFGEDPSAFIAATIDKDGRRISKEGNEIIKTYDFFGYIFDAENKIVNEVVISMQKTQSKKAKYWNTLIRQQVDKESGNQLPEYAGVYQLKTVPESNDKGSWFNYNIKFIGYTLGIPNIGEMIYNKAKSFADMIKNDQIKASKYEGENGQNDLDLEEKI